MFARQKYSSVLLCAVLLCVLCTMNTSMALAQYGSGQNRDRSGANHAGQNGGGHHGGGHNSGGHGHHQSNYRNGFQNGNFNRYSNNWLYGVGSLYYPQNYNYGYYQRPYPYHLDYYRMRYGGSYEPYAGNLYGPPLVQQYVAPTYVNPPYVSPPYVAPGVVSPPYVPGPNSSIRNYSGAYYW